MNDNTLPLTFHRSFLWLAAVLILGTEIFSISYLVDAQAIAVSNSFSYLLSHAGVVMKWVITAMAIFALLVSKTYRDLDAALSEDMSLSRLYWALPLHVVCFLVFMGITLTVFNGVYQGTDIVYLGWIFFAALTLLTLAVAIAPGSNWITLVKDQRFSILCALGISLLVVAASLYSRMLWEPLSAFTLHGSNLLLNIIYSEVHIDVAEKLLGAKEFIAHVSEQCSGIDGLMLSVGITSAYLYLDRQRLSFPKALIMIPIAAVLALLFNVLRVSMLISIGASISPEIAVEGFHSVAGWIASVLIALLIIFGFSTWTVFQKPNSGGSNHEDQHAHGSNAETDLATAILMPFILFLGATLFAGIFESDFDYLYPAKIVLPFIALIFFWSKYSLQLPKRIIEPVAMGIVVAILWVILVPADEAANSDFTTNLLSMPVWATILWFSFRIIGFWIFAPVAEELVFRGYLLNRLSGISLSTKGAVPFSAVGFLVTSILFGLLHADWIAGGVAGAIFAIARYRSNSIVGPIICHAVANIGVGIWALGTQNWILM